VNGDESQSKLKNIVSEYFELIKEGKFKEGSRFFSPGCRTHNPYVSGDMDTLTDAMISASKDMATQLSQPEFIIKHILVDGNLVAAHTQLFNYKPDPGKGGLRQVHIFRFQGEKIIEYWDITQQILSSMPNAGGAF